MKKDRITTVCNLICAVLLLAMLITQFQPFWTCSNCKSHKEVDKEVSIAEYIWTPKHHKPITDDMTDHYRELLGEDYRDEKGKKFKFQPNDILPATVTVFLGSVVGILVCVLLRKKFFAPAIPLIVGIAGILGYTTYPALQIGHNWQTHLILAAVLAVIALIALVWCTVLEIRFGGKKRQQRSGL